MTPYRRQFGFSLIEAMLATGILGVGLVLIAMVFPVGIKLTSITTERTIGAIAADEAFAKIKLWGLPDAENWPVLPNQTSVGFLRLLEAKNAGLPGWSDVDLSWKEFLYESNEDSNRQRVYHWSALCRKLSDNEVQVTVFVTRKVAPNIQFRSSENLGAGPLPATNQPWPSPVTLRLGYEGNPKELKIVTLLWGDEYDFFSAGTVLVDDRSGKLYYVQETQDRDGDGLRETLVLREPYVPPEAGDSFRFWVIPPGIGSPRNPVIAVRQKVMRLE